MTMTKNTPGLDRMRKIVSGLGGTYRADPMLTSKNADKIEFLRATGRDFLRGNPAMTKAAVRYMQQELATNPNATTPSLLKAAVEGMQAHVLLRFKYSGNDVELKPLTAKYLARKIARGLDRRIGIATGALVKDLSKSTWRIAR